MITVTAAIIQKDDRILAARRKSGQHLAGYWEFPGGKVEQDESEEQCIIREMHEEFNIRCSIDSFFMESIHDYGSKIIKLRGYLVQHISGIFECRVHDSVIWLPLHQLETIKWAPADLPFVKKISAQGTFHYGN